MRTSWLVACAAVLILGMFSSGCSATGETASPAATQDAQGDGIHEYRAVCTQKNLHDGNEIVLTRWLDTRKEAADIGGYHANFKYKGHVVRIEERVKAKRVVPPQ